MYSTIWWLLHSRIPKQGLLYVIDGESVDVPQQSCSLCSHCRLNFLTNMEMHFPSYFQALPVVIVGCAEGQEDLLVLLMPCCIGMFSLHLGKAPWAKIPVYSTGLGSSQRAHRPLPAPAWLGQQFSLDPSLRCPLLRPVLSFASAPYKATFILLTGEICLDRHVAVGCGWCRVAVVGVYFHKTNELGDPFVSIIPGRLNYLCVQGVEQSCHRNS